MISGLIVGLIYGLFGGLMMGLTYGLRGGLIFALIGGLIGCLGGGALILIPLTGMATIERIEKKLRVQMILNQSIWNSLQGLLWTTVLSYLLGMILGMIIFSTSLLTNAATNNYDWTSLISLVFPLSLKVGLICTLIFVFTLGNGLACLQYLSLRIILRQSGTIPWNFARFLNYCVERRLLLRVGGRYRFLHRELLDHFAQLPPGTQIK